jgi:hypothetical protein
MTTISTPPYFGARVKTPNHHQRSSASQKHRKQDFLTITRKLVSKPAKPIIRKAETKRIQAQILTLPPQAIAGLRYILTKSPVIKKIVDATKRLNYPVQHPDFLLNRMVRKSSTKDSSWPDFCLDDLNEEALQKCKAAVQHIPEAGVALNKGQHYHHALGFLRQANGKFDSVSGRRAELFLISRGLLQEAQVGLIPAPGKEGQVKSVLTKAFGKQRNKETLDYLEQSLVNWYVALEARNNLGYGPIQDLKKVWAIQKRKFQKEHYGSYPVRHPDGSHRQVKGISPSTVSALTKKSYSTDAIKPLISSKTSDAQRALARRQNLVVRRLRPEEKGPYEEGIRNGAFAARDFEKNEFISDYGGIAFPKVDHPRIPNPEYLLYAGEHLHVDGDTPLSRANTKLIYDEQGRPVRESRRQEDFNAEIVGHPAVLEDKTSYSIPAAYATRAIKEGDEIRLPYGYTPDQVRKMFGSQ